MDESGRVVYAAPPFAISTMTAETFVPSRYDLAARQLPPVAHRDPVVLERPTPQPLPPMPPPPPPVAGQSRPAPRLPVPIKPSGRTLARQAGTIGCRAAETIAGARQETLSAMTSLSTSLALAQADGTSSPAVTSAMQTMQHLTRTARLLTSLGSLPAELLGLWDPWISECGPFKRTSARAIVLTT